MWEMWFKRLGRKRDLTGVGTSDAIFGGVDEDVGVENEVFWGLGWGGSGL